MCEVMDQNRAIQQGDEVEYTPVLSKDKVCVGGGVVSVVSRTKLLCELQFTAGDDPGY